MPIGYNDKHGLMICGYEWGWSKADEAAYVAGEYKLPENKIDHTFANKSLYFGEQAKKVALRQDDKNLV